jgi:hypothetical protein
MKWLIRTMLTPIFNPVDLFIVVATIALVPDNLWYLLVGVFALVCSTFLQTIMEQHQENKQH